MLPRCALQYARLLYIPMSRLLHPEGLQYTLLGNALIVDFSSPTTQPNIGYAQPFRGQIWNLEYATWCTDLTVVCACVYPWSNKTNAIQHAAHLQPTSVVQ